MASDSKDGDAAAVAAAPAPAPAAAAAGAAKTGAPASAAGVRVTAHVKDKVITIPCGPGSQTLRWLGQVAIARYNEDTCKGWLQLGTVTGMTRHGAGADGDDGASGEALDLNAIVSMTFKDGDHVDVAHSLGNEA